MARMKDSALLQMRKVAYEIVISDIGDYLDGLARSLNAPARGRPCKKRVTGANAGRAIECAEWAIARARLEAVYRDMVNDLSKGDPEDEEAPEAAGDA